MIALAIKLAVLAVYTGALKDLTGFGTLSYVNDFDFTFSIYSAIN
jgi:hypothetical protein